MKYEPFLHGILLERKEDARNVAFYSDLKLVIGQSEDIFEAKHPMMMQYWDLV